MKKEYAKEYTRDYATEAFRLYAAMGKPTYEQARTAVYEAELAKRNYFDPATAVQQAEIAVEKKEPMLLDILAVDKTIEILERGGKSYIVEAIKEVYFIQPSKPITHSDIYSRVLNFSLRCPTDTSSVYRWLKKARLLCVSIRGLRLPETKYSNEIDRLINP